MQQTFAGSELVSAAALADLNVRSDGASLLRLALHLGLAVSLLGVLLNSAGFAHAIAVVLLAPVFTSLFAPFHECTHRTAFRSQWLNTLGVWLTAAPLAISPAVYRAFHYEHHRHTNDPERDPELITRQPASAGWPSRWRTWLVTVGGFGALLRPVGLLRLAVQPAAMAAAAASWGRPDLARAMLWETRLLACVWLVLAAAAVVGLPGARGLLAAALLGLLASGPWLSAEHTGMATDGPVLARTRTTRTPAVLRWLLWNMNFHAEHHGWPAVPWHRLPALPAQVADHVPAADGYVRLHWRHRPGVR